MKVLIAGYGRMGRLIEKTLIEAGDEVVGRIDTKEMASATKDKKVISADELDTVPATADVALAAATTADVALVAAATADVIMDFSNPSLTDKLVDFAEKRGIPLLSGTTNMTAQQHEKIANLSANVPVIWASNYSLGVNLFMHILPQVASTLSDWDIEITETHHNKKVDAPSGTAKSLADAIDPKGEYKRVLGRSGNCGERTSKEIGMHALRGGTVTGEHKVDFFGNDEVFEITHKAGSRQILVDGAIAAAHKLVVKEPGLYTMERLLFG